MTEYDYSLSTDFPAPHEVSETQLIEQIHLSTISGTLDSIDVSGDTVALTFVDPLSGGDKTTLDGIVAAHVPQPEIYDSTAIIRDEKSTTTNGGNLTQGVWTTRNLNTTYGYNVYFFVSVASNIFTLQPGHYLISAVVKSSGIGTNQLRIYDVTNSAPLFYGNNSTGDDSDLQGYINTDTVNQYSLQQFAAGSSVITNGLGVANSFGGPEVYVDVRIEQL
ncbi:MAG: hypothetical protein Solivirus3_23 [Solivirus sp.]|uniref:Uncharacterized protein n=1 Tax=Solivirus sp. TaxID=2487772 RepID=A0A3G5AJG6_9VIRU|nr:MAG: hypothetical protein Solivirus3_23 [Solivirus sp.]